MSVETIAILSAGEMGSAVGGALVGGGFDVLTCSAGRSDASRRRAEVAGLREVPDLTAVVAQADLVLSILVPSHAHRLARGVAEALGEGSGRPIVFADCNAVAPRTVRRLATGFASTRADFMDGSIVGGPPKDGYRPRLYVSGARVDAMAQLDGSAVEVIDVGPDVGHASALKMCYAALTKGTAALQAAMLAAAARLGVYDHLVPELVHSQALAYERMQNSMRRLPEVSHRWVGEMHEIAETFDSVGLTPDFHRGAAAIFELIAAAGIEGREASEEALRDAAHTLAATLATEPS